MSSRARSPPVVANFKPGSMQLCRRRPGNEAVVTWIKFDEQMHAFPGTATAKKLLNVAAMTRPSEFEPVQTEAGTLNDLFFMKYRLEHYDVPREFSRQQTIGVRVFDDDEAGQV